MAFAVRNLVKSYGGVPVLKGVDLDVRDGEIHALLGANGAGKSTLIKCICGAVPPDSGTIEVAGTSHASLTPRTAKAAGISVVQQELSLALSLDVTDNVFLGEEMRFGPFVRRRAQRRETKRWLELLGIDLDPSADPADLGNAELQMISIIRALRAEPAVLILDEPTAALSEREAENLGRQLIGLKNGNLPILYVTHRLSEVFALADRVSVLRGGEIVLSGPVTELSHDQIVQAIVGNAIDRRRGQERDLAGVAEAVLVDGLLAPRIGPITFSVKKGEILGVYGLVGSGRTELLETIFGAVPMEEGRIWFGDEEYRPRSPTDAVRAGIALVPADRLRKSIISGMTAADNLLLSRFDASARCGLRSFRREAKVFARTASDLNLTPLRSDLEVRRFSGGNQQKLAIGRWINELAQCRLLMLDEPTQGVDVGARKDIYDALRGIAAKGDTALIVTSSEPEELIQIADRVLVLSGGRPAGFLKGDNVQETTLIVLAHKLESEQRDAA